MFQPSTQRIQTLSNRHPERIQELESILSNRTNIYIDYSNIRPWSEKLGWHVDPKRLKQFFESFSDVNSIRLYTGELIGSPISSRSINGYRHVFKHNLITKPVKVMNLSIDVSSIPQNDPAILKDFIRAPLLRNLTVQTIEFLNNELSKLNQQGILSLEDRKCNFDVEIGTDMLLDLERNNADTFILWSGDSDFADPISKILNTGKRVYIFATARRVSTELNHLRAGGLQIFDIKKIRNFICWLSEIT